MKKYTSTISKNLQFLILKENTKKRKNKASYLKLDNLELKNQTIAVDPRWYTHSSVTPNFQLIKLKKNITLVMQTIYNLHHSCHSTFQQRSLTIGLPVVKNPQRDTLS